MNGTVNQSLRDPMSCHRVHIKTASSDSPDMGYITVQRKVKEIVTPCTVERMFTLEFHERERRIGLLQEGRKF